MKCKWILLMLVLVALTACTADHEAMRQRLKYVSDCNRADTVFTERWLPTVDSLVAYFDRHGSANDRMMAHYVLGRVYHDMGEAPQALECYQRAAEQADTTRSDCDLYTLYAVYGQMASIFNAQFLPDDEMQALKMAERIAWQDKDTLSALIAYELRIRPFFFKKDTDSIEYITNQAYFKFSNCHIAEKSQLSLPIIINISLDRKDYDRAGNAIRLYEKVSEQFDSLGNIVKGREIYYYDKGRYELAVGNVNSAITYFNKTLDGGFKEAGYRGLLSVYEKLGKPDSISKYAKLFAAANDSSFLHVNQQQVDQVRANYNYQKHVNEAQRLKEANTLRGWLLCLGLLALLVLLFLLLWVRAKARERKLRLQELHRVHEELQAKYALLTESQADDHSYASRLVELEKEKIWVSTRRIQESDVFKKLQQDPACAVGNQELWDEVERVVNEAYPGFSDRLQLLLPRISAKEKQVSLLLKAQLSHQLIAEIICETQNGESNIRRRLSKKLFPSETPSSSKFDDFIGSL